MTETPNPNIVDTDTLTGEMHPIRRVVVALGSNLGERFAALQGAVDALADTPDFFVTGVSPVYETEPVDSPRGRRALPQRRRAGRHHPAGRPPDGPGARDRGRLRPRAQRGPERPADPRRRPDRGRRPSHRRGLPAPAAPARPRAGLRAAAVARPRARRRLPRRWARSPTCSTPTDATGVRKPRRPDARGPSERSPTRRAGATPAATPARLRPTTARGADGRGRRPGSVGGWLPATWSRSALTGTAAARLLDAAAGARAGRRDHGVTGLADLADRAGAPASGSSRTVR